MGDREDIMFESGKAVRTAIVAIAAMAGVTTVANAAEFSVDQRDLRFVPDSLTVKIGDTVRFTDTDRITHNVTVVNPDGRSEDRGMSTYHEHIVVKFDKAGVYHVRCSIHPEMKMTVTVATP